MEVLKMLKSVVKRNVFTMVKDKNGNFSKVFHTTSSEFKELKKSCYHEKSCMFDKDIFTGLALTDKGTSLIYYKK
jgi:hypothetical protein